MPAYGSLIFPVDLTIPRLPPVLEGLRIAHLSDLHIRRDRPRHDTIVAQLSALRLDLIFLTGDYMSWSPDEAIAATVMRRIIDRLRARIGVYGVYGNHDTDELRAALASTPVKWLNDQVDRPAGLPLEIMGLDLNLHHFYDSVAMAEAMASSYATAAPSDEPMVSRPIRLMLGHLPSLLPVAADLGVDVLFAGHTHGGQCRLPGGHALRNSSDFPLGLTSGILRQRHTLCVVSRGLGEIRLPFRVFCPPHVPVYTLRRGKLPGRNTPHIENVRPW